VRLAPRGCREQRVVRETCDPHTLALGAASSRCPGRIAALEADNERLKVTPPPAAPTAPQRAGSSGIPG
jgi:hypothetical protein